MTDAQQRLADVRAAISRVLKNGQRLRRQDREVQLAELNSLRLLEKQYAEEVVAEQALLQGRGRNRISYVGI
ncbi:hypothetical protein [Pseudomonas chlororaphis]|uniref:hypothetical protein n=1 Tax=Pseudomonas chlororaphis TaxID=587753 RepID=UPI0006A5C75F|nr:hypothetical protein [Pseudomonas chlororaphis]AZD00690.1 hypothetical protein C4K27_1481 [Pseudomonas chlororaphis subsp. chlororaphis]MBM0283412.1 hypothetical protein [Pseudomonas chlororaphis]MDO1503739.1 hypothetical protein [Pseudomonas chlororaphis]ORM48803.1 hypothetical protein B6D51_04870 [Pseudomonas chlororaphis subsp. chlororaphis]TWR95097.1 hypothetical protein FJD36_18840 [Pseudomonas chlororaphis subsp. chlororaphis]